MIKSDTLFKLTTVFILVYSEIDQWLKQTLYVSYFTNFIWGSFNNWPVDIEYALCYLFILNDFDFSRWLSSNLIRHFLLDILLSWFLVYSVIDKWLNKRICLRYITEFILVVFGNWPVIKVENIGWIFYWIVFGYIWQLASG